VLKVDVDLFVIMILNVLDKGIVHLVFLTNIVVLNVVVFVKLILNVLGIILIVENV
jgi:hypothetical protein